MTDKLLIGALAEDLYRVALGLYGGKEKMANVFVKEVLKRKEAVNMTSVKPHIYNIINQLPQLFSQTNMQKKAENALMLSAILRNYAQKM